MVPEERPITNLCEAGGMGNRRRSDDILCTSTRTSTFMIEENVAYERDKSRCIIQYAVRILAHRLLTFPRPEGSSQQTRSHQPSGSVKK